MPIKKYLAILLFIVLLGISTIAGIKNVSNTANLDPEEQIEATFGTSERFGWIMFNAFSGYRTKTDASKLDDGASPNGQNTVINDGDRVSVRDFGSTLLGQATTTESSIEALHTFRRRDGENIMMRAYGSNLEYYEEGNDQWEILRSDATSANYDFADYNINTDLASYVYLGNGSDTAQRWTGAHVLTDGAIAASATHVTSTDPTGLGFPVSGSIIYCGQEVAYTSWDTTGFEVASAHVCDSDRGIATALDDQAGQPKGNIYLVANNRLFIAGIASTSQAVYFSKYGDATDFVGASLITEATADAAGIFNLGEGGGGVTGMALDEGATYIFKKSLIYKVTLDGDGLYTIVPLKPFDGKSQTTGAVTNESVFTGGNGVFFITPDDQIMSLSRVDNVDYPQIKPVSDPIKPTIQAAVFASSTGIFFQDSAYISARSGTDVTKNDTVFYWNDRVQTWEAPIIGWNPSAFTIYDDGTGEALYFGDSRVAQVYKVTPDAIDNELGITSNWRSKRFDFGEPHQMKEIDAFYVEGYISDNTTLNISLLYDEDGETQIYTTEFSGTEEDYQYDADEFNLFGFHPFGYERFGSGDDTGGHKFRVYLTKNLKRVPFYNIQVEFASDGVGQDWEILTYGFHAMKSTQPEDKQLYRSF